MMKLTYLNSTNLFSKNTYFSINHSLNEQIL